MGRNERRPVSRTGTRRSRRRKNSCPTAASGRRACSRCRPSSAASSASKAAPASSSASSAPMPTISYRHARALAQLHDLVRIARRPVRILAWLAGRPDRCRAARALRRSTNCSPTVRTARSQSFEIGNPDLDPEAQPRRRGQLCTHQRVRSTLTANALLQPLFELHLPGADRRDRGRSAGVPNIRQGTADYYGFEAAGDAKLGEALGVEWGGEIQRRRGPRDDQGFRPGAVDPAAAPASAR